MGVDPNYYQLQAYGMTINKIFYAIVNAGTFTGWHEVLQNFGASYAANGYEKLSDGLTIQWGVYTASDNTNQNITFPVTFNTCFGVVTSSSGKHFENSAVLGWNNSYFTSWSYFSETRFFIAIGI